jgi:hypothetical protein
MVFTPTTYEDELLEAINGVSHNEINFIRMTETMYKKSIIDANLSLRILLKENFKIDYENIKQGTEYKILGEANILTQTGLKKTKISYYRPITKKGDPRFCVYGLKKIVLSDELFVITNFEGLPLIIPIKGNIEEFTSLINSVLGSGIIVLTDIQKELIDKLKSVVDMNWIKTKKGGDTGVGFTFESLIGIKSNSNKEPDYKGIEIKCSRKNGNNTLQTLFSKVPNYSIVKDRGRLIKNHGYWDDEKKRFALYITINAINENSKGWKLKINKDKEHIMILHNNEETVYYDFNIIKSTLETKHKESLFIKALTQNRTTKNDKNEEFKYESAVLCEGSSFSSFISLVEKGLVTLDFLIHHDPETGKTRDHGFLWRINRQYLPLLFKKTTKVL